MAREDTDKAAQQTKESLIKAENELREAHNLTQRLIGDVSRMTAELDSVKKQLHLREDDARVSLASLREVQKQAVEEKGILRAEIR